MHYVFGNGMTCVINVQPVWVFFDMVCKVCKHVENPTCVWKIPHVYGKPHSCVENPTCVWKIPHGVEKYTHERMPTVFGN